MFYLNEEKLKEYSVVNYLKTEKFKTQLKPKLLKLIKNEGKASTFSALFKKAEQLISPLNSKLDNESLQKLNKYSSYLGKGSEFFLERIVEYGASNGKPKLESIRLENSGKIVKDATKDAEKYFKSKKVKMDDGVGFYELGTLTEYKYAFLGEQGEFEKHEDSKLFTTTMHHFKEWLPYFKHCINGEKFTKQYQLKASFEYKHECELTQGEFDFYNSAESELVELKFHKKGGELNGIWQILLYTYLLDFYYELKVQKIRIVNTFSGESLSISLSELFVANGQEKFYALLKVEISDYEKLRFMNRILSSFKDGTLNSNLNEIIANNFFCKNSDPMLIYYANFIKELNQHRGKKNFISNIHSANGIGAQGVKFSAQKQK